MKKAYVLYSLLFVLFIGSMLNAADNDVTGQNEFKNLPYEKVVEIFAKLSLEDVSSLYQVNKQFNKTVSDEKLIAKLVAKSSSGIKKQATNGLTLLPHPLFSVWHTNQKNKKIITQKLMNIMRSHQDLFIAKRALGALAEKLGTPVNALTTTKARIAIAENNPNDLQRWVHLGAKPQDINPDALTGMYSRLFSKAIENKTPEEALRWLNMGIQPSNGDYENLSAIYADNRATMDKDRIDVSFGILGGTHGDISEIKLKHFKKNQPYFELLSKIMDSRTIPQQFQKPIKRFKALSESSSKKLEQLAKK